MQKLTKKDLWKVFWWSNWFTPIMNFEKFASAGFTLSLLPAIEKLYKKKEERFEAYKRHQEFFLTENQVARTVIGITAAMEERLANDEDFPPEAIQGVKAAMMGPLAGIGDSVYHGTLRPIFASIAISLVEASGYTSLLGPLVFFIIMGAIGQLINWFGIFKGYDKGVELLDQVGDGNLLDSVREYAAIAGNIIMGGFAVGLVRLNLGIQFELGDSIMDIQSVLDGLVPSLLPVCYTLLMFYLINKKSVKPLYLMLFSLLFGTLGHLLGILA